ncbi:MAG: hypothetical protein LQ342_004722 [Letrouitia transgressa]|nr:MAG: hypothetical protein LQ342_004722 [Letrouitia transgressa]
MGSTETIPPKYSLGNVLVVGGCGFLGHHIVRELLDGYSANVSVLDLRTTHNRIPGVSYHDGDIAEKSSVLPTFQSLLPKVVIHTASPAFTSKNATLHKGKSAALFDRVNVQGTQNLLDCSREVGTVQAFVYTSSSSVIHDQSSPLCNASEKYPVLFHPLQPEHYSHTKACAEKLVLDTNRTPSSPTTNASSSTTDKTNQLLLTCSLRPAGLFGEGDAQLVPGLLQALAKRQTKYQLGPNTNLFDFTYVRNAAHAHVLAAIALLATHRLHPTAPLDHERVDGEAFFVTNAQPVYFWDFARAVWSAAGDATDPVRDVWVVSEGVGLGVAGAMEWVWWALGLGTPSMTRGVVKFSCMTRYFDTSKAGERLGYKPIVGLEEGVRRTVKWFLQEKKEDQEKGGK